MKVEIVAKNYRVTQDLKDIINKKINKLDKYFDDDAQCKIYLKKEKINSKMEVSLNCKSLNIRAEGKGENFYDIIDLVLPKLERQIHKHRSKLEAKLKQGAYKGELIYEQPQDDDTFHLVKTKQFDLMPITQDEAITEFELLGYNFYVFQDAEDMRVKVLYLREDGNIGLIDPIVK